MTAPTHSPTPVDTAKASAWGRQMVLLLAASGSRISENIGERLENPDLAHNVPVLVLCEISLRGPRRPRDLLELTHLTSGAMTKQLDHLEQLGLVRRQFGTVSGDRRGSLVSLTAEGERAAEMIGQAIEDHIGEFVAMRDELNRLLDV